MKATKLICLLLALALIIGCVSGCTKKEDNPSGSNDQQAAGDIVPEELTLPLTTEKEELTVWLVYSGSVMSDLNQIEGVKKMEEITGVHINWIPISQNELGDKLGILLSSGNYPDIVYPGSQPFPGGLEKGIADGVIYPDHDTLIRKYMPNYMNYLNNNAEAHREATADSGKMIVVKNIVGGDGTTESEGTYQGCAYRKDILDSLGIEEPKTIDEWHDALVKCQENGIEHPFMLNVNGDSFLSLSWGVVSTGTEDYLQINDNKVTSGILTEGYHQYLDTMRQWYAEGLIDPNFTSFNFYLDTPNSVENNQHVLYSLILSAFTGNNYYKMHMVTNENEFLQPIVAPALKEGDAPVQCGERIIAKDSIFITTSCKNPVLAAKWLDFQYTKEGELLNWYGIENETYTIDENGIPQFTDMVLHHENQIPPAEVLERYALNWGNSWLGKHNTVASEKVATAAAGGMNQQSAAVEIWSSPAVNLSTPTRS
ncbi:MAG: extracellular solute-binding protein, partial [Oscillospiraceae bacterium]|nr:extracellular solute-binding protein [Oscillospiraceae bacterium]